MLIGKLVWWDGAAVPLSTTGELFVERATDFLLCTRGMGMGTPLQPGHRRRRGTPPPSSCAAWNKGGVVPVEFAIGHELLPPLGK